VVNGENLKWPKQLLKGGQKDLSHETNATPKEQKFQQKY